MGERNYLDRQRYKEHRKNLLNPEKKTKTDPPILKPESYVSHGILCSALQRIKEIENANRQLVTKINTINRTKGVVDSHEVSLIRESNYKTRLINNLLIEKANKDLYYTISMAGSKYSKKSQMDSYNDRKGTLLFISKHPEIYKNELLDPLEKWSILPDKNSPEMARCNPQKRMRCFLDFEILNERKLGRMYLEIYNDFVPIAGDNFLRFIRGEKGKGYKNTELYIIMPGIGFLGGDVDHAYGASPRSAYGKPFASENYLLKFNGPGVIASFTFYPNINFCQFFVTFQKLPFLKNQYVVIGRVIKNLRTLEMIEEFGTKSGTPRKPITITNCGIFTKK